MSAELGAEVSELVRTHLREVQDFPEEGVLFRDITPLLADGHAFAELIRLLADHYRGRIDAVAGPVIGIDYELEYGKARMELNPGLVEEGARVLVVDDVLATGGTAAASVRLLEQCGAKVEAVAILLELEALGGRSKLEPHVKVETAVVF